LCRAFWGFDEHFKEQANQLFSSLDSAQQKQVQSVRQPQQQLSQPSAKVTSRCRSISTDRSSFSTHRSVDDDDDDDDDDGDSVKLVFANSYSREKSHMC